MHVFGINPNSESVVLQYDSGIVPSAQPPFKVCNIGRTPIVARVVYGTKLSWLGTVIEENIQPGQTKVLSNYGKSYYVLGLTLKNTTPIRAIVAASQDYYTADVPAVVKHNDGGFDINYNSILKTVVKVGVKTIPTIGSSLSEIVNTIWPKNKPNVWQQIKDQVAELVDTRIQESIIEFLSGDVRHIEERIKVLQLQLEQHHHVASHYMNIAEDLIGFEKRFSFSQEHHDYKKINLYLLNLYSTLVMMKVKYYIFGLKNIGKIGLSGDDVAKLNQLLSRLITSDQGANNYISNVYKEIVDHTYSTAHPGLLYDTLMLVRTAAAVNGLEFITIWNHLLQYQTDDNVYNNVISYSEFYGRLSYQLAKEALSNDLPPPLTPKLLSNGRRNRLVSIKVYIWRINNGAGPAKIGGMQLTFENGDNYMMGTASSEVNMIEFKGAKLVKLTVTGDGAVDRMTFYFSDGRQITVGTDHSQKSHTFEMENHHIVSLVLTSDPGEIGGQALNIAVSYQRNYN